MDRPVQASKVCKGCFRPKRDIQFGTALNIFLHIGVDPCNSAQRAFEFAARKPPREVDIALTAVAGKPNDLLQLEGRCSLLSLCAGSRAQVESPGGRLL